MLMVAAACSHESSGQSPTCGAGTVDHEEGCVIACDTGALLGADATAFEQAASERQPTEDEIRSAAAIWGIAIVASDQGYIDFDVPSGAAQLLADVPTSYPSLFVGCDASHAAAELTGQTLIEEAGDYACGTTECVPAPRMFTAGIESLRDKLIGSALTGVSADAYEIFGQIKDVLGTGELPAQVRELDAGDAQKLVDGVASLLGNIAGASAAITGSAALGTVASVVTAFQIGREIGKAANEVGQCVAWQDKCCSGRFTSSACGSNSESESFDVTFESDAAELGTNTLRLTDEQSGADVTPPWSSAYAEWTGAADQTGWLEVILMTPGTEGTVGFPGPRWLKTTIAAGTPPEGSYPLAGGAEGDPHTASVLYVDTDDSTEAASVDTSHVGEAGWYPQGTHWWGSGSVELEALDGTRTGSQSGDLQASLAFDGVQLETLDGRKLRVEGRLGMSAHADPPPVATAPPVDSGVDGGSAVDGGSGACGTMSDLINTIDPSPIDVSGASFDWAMPATRELPEFQNKTLRCAASGCSLTYGVNEITFSDSGEAKKYTEYTYLDAVSDTRTDWYRWALIADQETCGPKLESGLSLCNGCAPFTGGGYVVVLVRTRSDDASAKNGFAQYAYYDPSNQSLGFEGVPFQ